LTEHEVHEGGRHAQARHDAQQGGQAAPVQVEEVALVQGVDVVAVHVPVPAEVVAGRAAVHRGSGRLGRLHVLPGLLGGGVARVGRPAATAASTAAATGGHSHLGPDDVRSARGEENEAG
ncbi:unnamed protein product, partial [Ixodes pacificus]